jgi:hypothetical protein
VSRQDIADIGAIKNILQCRQYTDPNRRAPVTWNEPASLSVKNTWRIMQNLE